MTMRRAFSILKVKAVDDEERTITGIASSPTPDRMGDILEPMGAKFQIPMPLLLYHNSREPVGTVDFAKPTKDGIPFRASLPKVVEEGTVKTRVDEAWHSLKYKLIGAISVGFKEVEDAWERMKNGGIHFFEWEWLELSLVTIPAQPDAVITGVKSFDSQLQAALGHKSKHPGVSGKSFSFSEVKNMKTIVEQIAALEAARAAKAARMEEIMQKSMDEGRSTDEAESEEFDTLADEIKTADDDLKRLRSLEKIKLSKATPVVQTKQTEVPDAAAAARGGHNFLQLKQKVEPGIHFARFARCIGLAKGSSMEAEHLAKQLYPDQPFIASAIQKANVPAGSTVTGNWAAPLVGEETAMFADFVEFLRPQTILGRFGTNGIPSLRRVPFRVPLIGQTSGGSGYWVGEGKAKPLTSFGFERRTLEPLKVANIAVATEENLRDSSPSSELIIRDALASALRERLDLDFINPDKNAVAGISPASITNGIAGIGAGGTDEAAVRSDLKNLWAAFIAANLAPTSAVYIMSSLTALGLSLMVNSLGQPSFPGVTMNGGTLLGVPVITSEYVPSDSAGPLVILVNASDIYLGDDGGLRVDVSREASLEMSDAPSHDSTTPTAAQLVSMFQTNSVALRAERVINWMRRRDTSVAYLTNVQWGEGS